MQENMMYVRQLMAELRPGKLCASVDIYTDNSATVDIIKAHGANGVSSCYYR